MILDVLKLFIGDMFFFLTNTLNQIKRQHVAKHIRYDCTHHYSYHFLKKNLPLAK